MVAGFLIRLVSFKSGNRRPLSHTCTN